MKDETINWAMGDLLFAAVSYEVGVDRLGTITHEEMERLKNRSELVKNGGPVSVGLSVEIGGDADGWEIEASERVAFTQVEAILAAQLLESWPSLMAGKRVRFEITKEG